MKSRKSPNIEDVARKAGVSISTISRALKDRSQLRPETYAKVERAIRELEYRKSRRHPGAARAKTVAVILPSVLDPFFCVLLQGIDAVAKTYGYNILFFDSNNSAEIELNNAARLLEAHADGVILVPSGNDPRGYLLLREKGIRVVLLDRLLEVEEASCVVSNDEEGAYLAVKYLIDLGHRAILYVGGSHDTSTERARLLGYKRALREHGVAAPKGLIRECSFDSDSAYRAMSEILGGGPPSFTAVFAGNDLIAFGIRKALEENGLKVPADVSLVGYGDMPFAGLISLTSVSCPAFEMGKSALTLLVHILEGKFINSHRTVLRPTLILRSSCRQLNGG